MVKNIAKIFRFHFRLLSASFPALHILRMNNSKNNMGRVMTSRDRIGISFQILPSLVYA
jgi:hypothetical protein